MKSSQKENKGERMTEEELRHELEEDYNMTFIND